MKIPSALVSLPLLAVRALALGLTLALASPARAEAPRPLPGRAQTLPAATTFDAILFYGQSNAGASGTSKSVLTHPPGPRILSFASGRQLYGTAFVDPGKLTGLGPVADHPNYAPFPATAMGFALAAGPAPAGLFMHTVWYGGQPLPAFVKGTTSWQNLMAVAQRAPQVLQGAGHRGSVKALVFVQGEAGPGPRNVYRAALGAFLDEVLPALRDAAGQDRTPLAMLLQTNAGSNGKVVANGVELAQWDVASARPEDTVLAAPMYQFPLSDNIHQTAEGRMMQGDVLAQVYRRRVLAGQPFQPLHPVQARRDGRRITLAFQRPAGSAALSWDERWVAPAPDYGFAFVDPGSPAKIESVAITGPSEVTIMLDRAPSGRDMRLRYAQGQPPVPGWASARGQLVASSGEASVFAGQGYKVPATIDHYSIRFEMVVE
ncbi:hypothetical protein [Bosea sp. PAMC 26642]|uniref:hypothetical protein n=1 Tax=Bosea sp. (strain PAMC 26642) TaxID=1792307 RepID=UPI00077009CF|nr:hypothetical protein [Bosea sp. PAMC 26642]AMJ61162.1 hypothetical protein AXW83_13430 [Bosea sp. PAMC 26642]